jgi:immunoglobulin-binding protein 1
MLRVLQNVPLSELFLKGAKVVEVTSSIAPGGSLDAQLAHGTAYLCAAAAMVESLGLFSPNEDKDDITTSSLKYLLIPFYLAQLESRRHAGALAWGAGPVTCAHACIVAW